MADKSKIKAITLGQALKTRTMPALIKEVMGLDYADTKGLLKIDEGDRAHWIKILKKSPSSIKYLSDKRGGIVGYWHFVAPTAKMFDLAMKGKIVDGKIDSKRIHTLSKPGLYNIYFIEMLLVPELRDGRAIRLLYETFYDAVEAMARKGVLFNNWCMVAYTKDGHKVAKWCGMKYVTKHCTKGSVYAANFYEFLQKKAGHRLRLLGLYDKAQKDDRLAAEGSL
jgi:hypothetical protein